METVSKKSKGKGARPPKKVKLQICSGVRFSQADYNKVQEKAKEAGLRFTVYIRQMALKGTVIARISEEERLYYRQMSGMSNNVNQLAQMAHKDGLLSAVAFFEAILDRLNENLKFLGHGK